MTQLALPLTTNDRSTTFADVSALLAWLSGRGWVKYSGIKADFPLWTDRFVREVASDSQGRIISGQHGYKLTLESTPEEVRRATARLRSQVDRMTQRCIDIDRVFHHGARRTE